MRNLPVFVHSAARAFVDMSAPRQVFIHLGSGIFRYADPTARNHAEAAIRQVNEAVRRRQIGCRPMTSGSTTFFRKSSRKARIDFEAPVRAGAFSMRCCRYVSILCEARGNLTPASRTEKPTASGWATRPGDGVQGQELTGDVRWVRLPFDVFLT